MAITPRQWKGLVKTLDIAAEVAAIETERGVSFDYDEGVRYQHADILYPLVDAKIAAWTADELGKALDEVGGCWGEYKTMKHAVSDPALVTENPIFEVMKTQAALAIQRRARRPPFQRKTACRPERRLNLGRIRLIF